MVGRVPLAHEILVRVQVPQQNQIISMTYLYMSLHYKKIKQKIFLYHAKHNIIVTLYLSIIYIFSYLLNIAISSLVGILSKIFSSNSNGNTVIFIEPYKQGFGDLFFQTALFELLSKNNKKNIVLCKKQHLPIIQNNPYIERIYTFSFTAIIKLIIGEKGIVLLLGRSTIFENIIALLNIKKNIRYMDNDLRKWVDYLEKYDRPLFWQKIVCNSLCLETNTYFSPKLEISTVKDYIYDICIIAGVENCNKTFDLDNIMINLNMAKKIILIGKTYNNLLINYKKNGIINMINKTSYMEAVGIINLSNNVVGSEGSLIQISASLGKSTYIVSGWNRYIKNCDRKYINNSVNIETNLKLLNTI